jgi:ABC-type glycerol-3-phosphate transport system substrate-binding protein
MIFNNQIAMWWGHGGFISRYFKAAPKLNYLHAPLPGKTNQTSYITDNKFMVSSTTKAPDQSWEYLKFFTSKDSEAAFAPFEGHISVWESNWTLPVYEHPAYKGLLEQLKLKDTQPFIFHPGWVPVRNAIAREIQKVIFNQATVEDGLAKAQQAADKELAQLK